MKIDASQDCAPRRCKLLELVGRPELLNDEQAECLQEFLAEHHQAFRLDPEEHGETDLVQIKINTGDAPPKKQPVPLSMSEKQDAMFPVLSMAIPFYKA